MGASVCPGCSTSHLFPCLELGKSVESLGTCIHVGDLEGIAGSQLWTNPALAFVTSGAVNQESKDLSASPSLCKSFKSNQINLKRESPPNLSFSLNFPIWPFYGNLQSVAQIEPTISPSRHDPASINDVVLQPLTPAGESWGHLLELFIPCSH